SCNADGVHAAAYHGGGQFYIMHTRFVLAVSGPYYPAGDVRYADGQFVFLRQCYADVSYVARGVGHYSYRFQVAGNAFHAFGVLSFPGGVYWVHIITFNTAAVYHHGLIKTEGNIIAY